MTRVLIVDDYERILSAYKLILEEEIKDVFILTAKNEDEALDIIHSDEKIDVIITDLTMLTERGGMTILAESKIKDPLVMVILITAYDKKLNRKEAFELGAFDCLSKANSEDTTINLSEDELVYKTKNAISFRKEILERMESQKKITYFERYFDPIVFEKIKKDASLLTPAVKIITVAFWDIRGFSLLCENLKAAPELVANFLKEHFEIASRIISEKNGVLDKFIGDGIMATFGVFEIGEESYKTNAIAAIEAAKDLRKEFNILLSKYKKIFQKATAADINFGLGCGIHTGDAIIGNLGTDKREHFTALGNTVNLAARIEKEAVAGEILFSASTHAREDGYYVTKSRMIEGFKNIPGKYYIYELVESVSP